MKKKIDRKDIIKIGVLLIIGIFVVILLTMSIPADDPDDWTVGGNPLSGVENPTLGTTDDQEIQFITYNVQRMTITSDGDIGMGVADPSHRLEIGDNDNTAGRKALKVYQSGAISGTGYGIYVEKVSASTTNVAGYFSATQATNNYGLIVENGDVGIGTTSPDAKLVVQGSGTTGSTLALDVTDNNDNSLLLIKDDGNMYGTPMATPTGVTSTLEMTGSLPEPKTYTYTVTAIDGGGGETAASSSTSKTTTSTHQKIKIDWTDVTGAVKYRVYRTEPSSADTFFDNIETSSYTDDGTGGSAGSAPTTNNAWIIKFSPSGQSWLSGGDVRINDWLEVGRYDSETATYGVGGIKFMKNPEITSIFNDMGIHLNTDNTNSDEGRFRIFTGSGGSEKERVSLIFDDACPSYIWPSQNLGIGDFRDSGTNAVTTLDVDGGLAMHIVTKDDSYTATGSDFTILADAESNNVVITLPTVGDATGQILVIKRIDDSDLNTVTITGTIDEAANPQLEAQWDSIMIQSNGTSWYKLADK